MKLPEQLWKIKGTQPGPSFIILGGVHGDERTGVEIVKILRSAFGFSEESAEKESDLISGELVLAMGNPLAIKKDTRAAENGPDLNRSFSTRELEQSPSPQDRYDLVRARELAPYLANCDYLLDIHATSNPSEPFVCMQPYRAEAQPFLNYFPVRYIFSDPDCIYLGDEGITELCTTDSYVNRNGGIGICFESGSQKDLSKIPELLGIIGNLLLHTQMSNETTIYHTLALPRYTAPVQPQKKFVVSHSVLAQYEHFTYAPSMNLGWQMVTKGALVGTYANGENVYIPADGMYVFPKNSANITINKNLFTIAQEV